MMERNLLKAAIKKEAKYIVTSKNINRFKKNSQS